MVGNQLKNPLKKVLLLLGFISLCMIITQHYTKGQIRTSAKSSVQNFMNYLAINANHFTSRDEKVSCKMKQIEPFSKDIMKYMYDFGEHKCPAEADVQFTVAMKNFTLTAIAAILSVRMRQITDEVSKDGVTKDGFHFGEFQNLKKPLIMPRTLIKNYTGTIKNVLSKRCIVTEKFDHKSPPREIQTVFSSNCASEDADFTFTKDGMIRHVLTGKCLGPLGGATTTPKSNHKLVISDQCLTKWNVLGEGTLQMNSTIACIHPLGGGTPGELQNLCLWPTCGLTPQLSYRWFVPSVIGREAANERYPLVNDMNHVEVELINGKVVNSYLLSLVPKPPPAINSPSHPNIIIICMEKVSAQHFKRKLQRTNAFMKEIGAMEYKKHAAISRSSDGNLETLVNGNAKEGRNSIFSLAKKYNYMTMFSADDPLIVGGLNRSLSIDHNSLTFFRTLQKHYDIHAHKYCVSGQPIYNIAFNYLSYFLNSYPSHPKLAITLLSEICGPNFNFLSYMDENLTKLLNYLNSLKNTIVFILTLKGGDDGNLRKLQQGLDELKRPVLSVHVSDDIKDKYKFEATRLDELSTPFDVYVTLRHLITSQDDQKHTYGKSLLHTSAPRDCLRAGVDPAMCPCV